MTDLKNSDIGIRIISILFYIVAILYAISGVSFVLRLIGIGSFTIIFYLDRIIPVVSYLFGIEQIGIAILCFFVGRGLQKAQSWARITAIIFSVFLVLIISQSSWSHYIRNIFYLLLSMIIVVYLILRRNTFIGDDRLEKTQKSVSPVASGKRIKLPIFSFVLSILGLVISLLIGGTGIFTSLFFGALFYPLFSLFVILIPFLEIIAFITSIKSIIEIKRNKSGGMGFAVTALVISSLFIIFFIILLIVSIYCFSIGNGCLM